MFEKLQKKWKVSGLQLFLILCTFALGGSIDGRITHGILHYFFDDKSILFWFVYIILVTVLWPVCVLLVSIPFGQFNFFKNYLIKMRNRITGK